MINADKLQQLKEKTDILKIFESFGHEVKKKGKGYVTNCPFHKDDTPSLSITPKKKLWQCFGCGESGDVFTFIQKMDKTTFPKAAKKLAQMEGISAETLTVAEPKESERDPALNTKSPFSDLEILTKVTNYYHKIFQTTPEGKAYLKTRGITKETLFTEHKIGYVNGTLLYVLPKDEGVYQQLIRLGILLETKKERFYNCTVIPITNETEEVISLYGRHTKIETGGHFYLPGNRKGIFNENQLKKTRPEQLVITESIIDALSFIENELPNVMPIYGTNGFTEHHKTLLAALNPKEIILALDNDTQGQKATKALKDTLFSFNCKVVNFPNNQDANTYFKAHTKENFKHLLSPSNTIKTTNPPPQITAKFQIKWAELKGTRLAVTLKAENPDKGRFLLDTYNLYSAKDRDKLTQKAAELFGLKPPQVEKDIQAWLPEVEEKAKTFKGSAPNPEPETSKEEMTEAEEQEAMSLLKSPTLFKDIAKDYEELGYIGESMNKKLAYLVMTSRKMDNPLSLVIMSNSAAGKSSLQKATIDLCPPEDGKHFTRLTQQSLYYLGEESIKHKFLSIEEEEGSAEANYSIKTLLSSKQLTVAATMQDPQTGKKKAEEYKTEGPTAVMMSTTSPEIESELGSRVMIMTIDESQNQTTDIHKGQRHRRTLAGQTRSQKQESVKKRHHNAQRLLQSNLVIINDYAPQLTFPCDRLRHRRGNDHYLDLIETVAFLRQKQKEIKKNTDIEAYIEVDKGDIRAANEIFVEVLGWTIDELGPPTRKLLKQIVNYCKETKEDEFTARAIRERYKWGNTHLHNHLKKLEELEYITTITGKNGSKYTYKLLYQGDGENREKFVIGLKDPETLTKAQV